jgi:hypothetical protein
MAPYSVVLSKRYRLREWPTDLKCSGRLHRIWRRGRQARTLRHDRRTCQLSRGGRDDLTVDCAEAQYEEAAKALIRAAERQYTAYAAQEPEAVFNRACTMAIAAI